LDKLPHSALKTEVFTQGALASKKGYVCIPASNEEPFLSLIDQLHSQFTDHALFIFFNASADASHEVKLKNEQCYTAIKEHLMVLNMDCLMLLDNAIAPKIAGVGYARKTIMDRAAEECNHAESSWVSGLDADCSIDKNYLSSLDHYFDSMPDIQGASIKFAHLYSDPKTDPHIHYYESHLRYLKLALQWAQFPFYYHTVGSSMVVRASIYKKAGGMNHKKAGEDFYFLQKIMPHGYGEINDTCIFPSSRMSDRVPFGTGRAMGSMINEDHWIKPYPILAFKQLRVLMEHIQNLYQTPLKTPFYWPEEIDPFCKDYFENKGFEKSWNSISDHSKTTKSRNKKFLNQLSGNAVVLYLNQERERNSTNIALYQEIKQLFKWYNHASSETADPLEELKIIELNNQVNFLPKFSR